jgi:D-glycero-D-manno-heptose 1,7-bisphosphate phosphatase
MKSPLQRSLAVFLDKDGTLINDVPYNVDPSLVELAAGAAEGAALLSAAGYALVVVSNQSGVARGLFPEAAIAAVEARIRELLAECDVPLAGFYYCPHHPQATIDQYRADCECRKPAPGMLMRAAGELGFDLTHSWMIGDILDDVEAGHRAGCRSILIDNGHETLWQWNPRRHPDFVVRDLSAAARTILAAKERAVQTALETVP